MTDPAYTIRAAVAADADTIKRMVRSAPLDPDAIDWHFFRVLDIIENGAPKIVSIGMVRPEGAIYELDSVVTRPEYRKRGYAAAVVADLLVHAPRPVYLLAEDALVPFYERFGFHLMTPEASPAEMREQAEYVNRYWGPYHIMGLSE